MAKWAPLAVVITQADGSEERIPVSLRARLAVERRWPGTTVTEDGKVLMRNPPMLESALLVAWIGSGGDPDAVDVDAQVAAWAESIVSLEEVDVDPVPSEPAVSDA